MSRELAGHSIGRHKPEIFAHQLFLLKEYAALVAALIGRFQLEDSIMNAGKVQMRIWAPFC